MPPARAEFRDAAGRFTAGRHDLDDLHGMPGQFAVAAIRPRRIT
jgi:hypothetical protein